MNLARHRDDDPDRAIPVTLSLLGEARGQTYYTSERFPGKELVDRGLFNDDEQTVLAGPFVEEIGPDGTRKFRLFGTVAEGTYARLSAPPKGRPAKPVVGISALRSLLRFSGSPEVMVPGDGRHRLAEADTPEAMAWALKNPSPSSAKLLPGKPKATTPSAMLERIQAKGVTVKTLLDGRLVAFAEGGRIDPATIEALRRSAGLLGPLIAGSSPALCEAPECDHWAVDVLEPDDVLACEDHISPEAWT